MPRRFLYIFFLCDSMEPNRPINLNLEVSSTMKVSVNRWLKSSLLLFLWLLLVQFISSVLTGLVALIFGIIQPVGTALWQWIINGTLTCLFWLWMGWYTPHFAQPRPVGTVAVLTMWSMLTSFMRNMYLFLLPQRICGGMIIQIVQSLYYDSIVWLDAYWDLPIGCFLLSVALGVGLLLRRNHTKAIPKSSGEIT